MNDGPIECLFDLVNTFLMDLERAKDNMLKREIEREKRRKRREKKKKRGKGNGDIHHTSVRSLLENAGKKRSILKAAQKQVCIRF